VQCVVARLGGKQVVVRTDVRIPSGRDEFRTTQGQVLRHRSQLSTSLYAKVDQNALRPLARRWPEAGR
jgi:hypothetical protein